MKFVLACALFSPCMLAAQVATPAPSAVSQFQKIEDSLSIALVQKDQFALENLLQPSFIDISAAATVRTRNQSIADTLAGLPEPLLSIEQKVVNVRVVSDVAVVEGTYVLRLKEDQRTRDERGIFTHVYQRSRNAWSLVSAQRTAVVDALEGGKGKQPAGGAAEKKSNATLPFHIPLLYKGADTKTPETTPVTPPASASTPAPTPAPTPPQ